MVPGLVIREGKLVLGPTGGLIVRPHPTWNVATALSPSTIVASAGQSGTIAQLVASGGVSKQYTYSTVDSLPSGLSLSSSGVLSGDGTEEITAVADYTIRVANAAGSVDLALSIEIRAANISALITFSLSNVGGSNSTGADVDAIGLALEPGDCPTDHYLACRVQGGSDVRSGEILRNSRDGSVRRAALWIIHFTMGARGGREGLDVRTDDIRL